MLKWDIFVKPVMRFSDFREFGGNLDKVKFVAGCERRVNEAFQIKGRGTSAWPTDIPPRR